MTSRPRTEERGGKPERVVREEDRRPEIRRVGSADRAQDTYIPVMDRARCFQRHPHLGPEFEDLRCEHCAKFLTVQCPHVDMFIEDVEGLDED